MFLYSVLRMTRNLLQNAVTLISQIGADPSDSDDVRLQKALMLRVVFMFIAAGVFWGAIYIALGEPLAGSIPLSYSAVSLLSVTFFGLTRRYRLFCFSQLLLILLLPFLLMLALGGFVNSSAVILWSLICPLGALIFAEPRQAPRWFLAYIGLVALSGFLQPFLRVSNNLPPTPTNVFFVINIAAVSGVAFILLSYFVSQKNLFQEKSENLLLNILPREIVAILKIENRIIADHYDGASILFADVVNFTHMSAQMTATELVELLNEVFSHFDVLVEKHGLEKIKTIGDCYMVAAGVPHPRPDHAQSLSRMALEMQEYVSGREFRGRQLTFRIGINSGPVVAGVIGRKKFIYDLWGDAVNTASRMESQGVAGFIQVTRATYELIKDDFVCEPQGTVPVKGKGEMEVWYLLRGKT